MRHEQPGLRFSIDLPEAARTLSDVPPIYALTSADDRDRHRPTLSISSERPETPTELESWVDDVLARQTVVYPALPIDRLTLDTTAGTFIQTVHAAARESVTLALDQWWTLREGRAWTVAASCVDWRYAEMRDAIRQAALSLEPDP